MMPSLAVDAAGMMRAAIRSDGPVVFVENRRLYGRKEPRPEQLPEADFSGRAVVRRPGEELTLVAWSRMAHVAVEVADELTADGISVEVIDLRSISPIDFDTVIESVRKTSRILVVHEAVQAFGPGAEIVARIVDSAWAYLDMPPRILGGPSSPIPFNRGLEAAWLPSRQTIRRSVLELLERELSDVAG
jgi:2-oxoisovalerate dehydrogenase E1 component